MRRGSRSASATKRKITEEEPQKKSSKPRTKEQEKKLIDEMFRRYKDEDDTRIGPIGMETLCRDLGVQPDCIDVLIFAYLLEATTMGYFTQSEFSNGLHKLRCFTVDEIKHDLPILVKDIISDKKKFEELYKFSYVFCCEENKKSIDIETAASMLELVLSSYPHTKKFTEFLRTNKATAKVINKDQWICFLEFSKTIKPDLANYDENEAWPLLIDEFVEFLQNNNNN